MVHCHRWIFRLMIERSDICNAVRCVSFTLATRLFWQSGKTKLNFRLSKFFMFLCERENKCLVLKDFFPFSLKFLIESWPVFEVHSDFTRHRNIPHLAPALIRCRTLLFLTLHSMSQSELSLPKRWRNASWESCSSIESSRWILGWFLGFVIKTLFILKMSGTHSSLLSLFPVGCNNVNRLAFTFSALIATFYTWGELCLF